MIFILAAHHALHLIYLVKFFIMSDVMYNISLKYESITLLVSGSTALTKELVVRSLILDSTFKFLSSFELYYGQ